MINRARAPLQRSLIIPCHGIVVRRESHSRNTTGAASPRTRRPRSKHGCRTLSPVAGVNAMRTPVFTIDRSFLPSGADLVETIATISPGEIVQMEDSRKPPSR